MRVQNTQKSTNRCTDNLLVLRIDRVHDNVYNVIKVKDNRPTTK